MSWKALLPFSLYRVGFKKPSEPPATWSAMALAPANSGLDRLVPPIRYSLYFTDPSGKLWLCPTRKPVLGSATMATSGTARPGLVPKYWEMLAGTTPFW